MTAEDLTSGMKREQDYRSLPPKVRAEDTIVSVEPDLAPDPQAVRNVDQHRALRDD